MKELKTISPSEAYTILSGCPWSLYLKNDPNNHKLPAHPSAHLGKVVHEIYEKIFKGLIKTKEDFENEWLKTIEEIKGQLDTNEEKHAFPLAEKCPEYISRKKDLKDKISYHRTGSGSRSSGNLANEVVLYSADQLIKGKLDLIDFNKDEIIDIKTGQVFQENKDIKEDYKNQLKVYAYLFKENYHRYPKGLFIQDKDDKKWEVKFTIEECENLVNIVKSKFKELEILFQKGEYKELAFPAQENCKACNFRPSCDFYWRMEGIEDQVFSDVKGVVKHYEFFQNGSINLALESPKGIRIKITKINSDKIKYIDNLKNKPVAIFNLIKCKPENLFKQNPTLTFKYTKNSFIYEL